MLKLLHYDLMLHFASHVVTFLVKVTFCAINFVSSHPLPPPPLLPTITTSVFFRPRLNVELFMRRTKLSELSS